MRITQKNASKYFGVLVM